MAARKTLGVPGTLGRRGALGGNVSKLGDTYAPDELLSDRFSAAAVTPVVVTESLGISASLSTNQSSGFTGFSSPDPGGDGGSGTGPGSDSGTGGSGGTGAGGSDGSDGAPSGGDGGPGDGGAGDGGPGSGAPGDGPF